MHRVVILGGGFGGLYAAQALRKAPVDLTLIDRRNFHLFQPLLYQVATGALSPGDVASPLRTILHKQKNARVLLGEARAIDAQARTLTLTEETVPYDTLIVATGARSFYFGHDEWKDNAPGLKTLEDATAMRSKILYAYEAAEREKDPEKRRAWLTFVVAGAGPTGVELAGAMAEIAHDTLRHDFRSIRPEESRILLVDGSKHVLPTYPESLSIEARHSLQKLGVEPRAHVMVTGIDSEGVDLKGPSGIERIQARTVIWAAGVAPSEFGATLARDAGAQLDKEGRVKIEPDLTIPGHPEIMVIGDLAHLEQDGKLLQGVAPVAMQEGRYAARLIETRLKNEKIAPFRYFDKGSLAVIGRAAAVADLGKLRFHGRIAWLMWLFLHLMYLAQFQNRLIVLIHWGFLYLTFDRGARIIAPHEGRK